MSALANLTDGIDYPIYTVSITLSTGQTFAYTMVFQSGMPGQLDDGAMSAAASGIRSFLTNGAGGALPAGTTITSMVINRYTEAAAQRVII